PVVCRLRLRVPVVLERGAFVGGVVVELCVRSAEDRVLDRAVRRAAERLEAVLLLHFVRYLEASQAFDLPLRRTGPDGVRAPDDMVVTDTPAENTHHRGTQAWLRDDRPCKDLPEIAIDVLHAAFLAASVQVRNTL